MAQDKNLFRYRLQTAISSYADTNHRRFQDVVDEINQQLGYPEGTVQEWLKTNFVPNSAEVEYLVKKLTGGARLDHTWIRELYDFAGYEPPKYLVTQKPIPHVSAAGESGEFNQAKALLFEREMKVYQESLAKIFVSYARSDQEIVEQLYDFLKGNALNPWMDTRDIKGGENWLRAIYRAIEESEIFIAVLSNNSVSRRGIIQKELKRALDRWEEMLPEDIYIVPVRIDDCRIPELLSDIQVIDWEDGKGKGKLLEAIRAGLERREE